MKTLHVAGLPALLVVALTAGCENARTTRIRENAAHFDSPNLCSRKLIREGQFDFGFTSAAVCTALGKPNRIATIETEGGSIKRWTYKNFLHGNARGATSHPAALLERGKFAPTLRPIRSVRRSLACRLSLHPPLAALLLDRREEPSLGSTQVNSGSRYNILTAV